MANFAQPQSRGQGDGCASDGLTYVDPVVVKFRGHMERGERGAGSDEWVVGS